MRRRLVLTVLVLLLAAVAGGLARAAPLTANGRIAFTSLSGKRFSIYSTRSDGSDRKRMSDAAVDSDASWAPDGKHVVFARQRAPFDLYVMDAAGLDEHRVAKTSSKETAPAWSPDGTKVAFIRQARQQKGSAICVFDFRDRGIRFVKRSTRALTSFAKPSWSPDGKQLAFTAYKGKQLRGIYVVNVAGSGLRRLTRGSALDQSPAWSPDGRHIAFSSARTSSPFPLNLGSEIYVMDADGTHRTRLTKNQTFDGFPAWSPDGKRLAFSRFASTAPGKPITLDVFTIASSGGDEQRVTATSAAHESAPTWQPVAPPASGD